MNDVVETNYGSHIVPGIDKMQEDYPTRADVFLALVDLELEFRFEDAGIPTRMLILERMREKGSALSENSVSIVTKQMKHLEEAGMVYRVNDKPLVQDTTRQKKPLGSINYVVRTVLVCKIMEKVSEMVKENLDQNETLTTTV